MGIKEILKMEGKSLGKKMLLAGGIVLILVLAGVYSGNKSLESMFQSQPIHQVAPIANESQLGSKSANSNLTYTRFVVNLTSAVYTPRANETGVYDVGYVYINAQLTSNSGVGTYKRVSNFINTVANENLSSTQLADLWITVQNTVSECLAGNSIDNATQLAWAVLSGLPMENITSINTTCAVNVKTDAHVQLGLQLTAHARDGSYERVTVTINGWSK